MDTFTQNWKTPIFSFLYKIPWRSTRRSSSCGSATFLKRRNNLVVTSAQRPCMWIHWSLKERLRRVQDCSAPLSKSRPLAALLWLWNSCLSPLMPGVGIGGSMCCCTGLLEQGRVQWSESWCWIGVLGPPWPTSNFWFLSLVRTLANCQSKISLT